MAQGSVTGWLPGLCMSDPASVRRIWDRYYAPMVRLARTRLYGVSPGIADGDDVGAEAFQSFLRVVAAPEREPLSNRSDLWHLLATLTRRKAIDCRRRAAAARRGGGAVTVTDPEPVSGAPAREPDPSSAAESADAVRELVELLPDDELCLRHIVALKLAGYSNGEVGAACGCSERTVERRLGLVRALWERTS